MFYPYGFGGSSWLFYIGVPLIIGLWAQFRVSSAFRKWGEVRASSNSTGAEFTTRAARSFAFRVMFIIHPRSQRSASPRMRLATLFNMPKRMRRSKRAWRLCR